MGRPKEFCFAVLFFKYKTKLPGCRAILQSFRELMEPLRETPLLGKAFVRGHRAFSRRSTDAFGVNWWLKGRLCLIGIFRLLLFQKKKEKSVTQIDFSLFSVSSLIDLSLITQCWLVGVSVIFLAASEAREHGCAAGARRARGD